MKYSHVIITDKDNKPMARDEVSKQLCYCTDSEWDDNPFPVTTYTVHKAGRLIHKTTESRKKLKLSETKFKTMPFNYPVSKRYIWTNKKS